jgi:hypothetical protein
MSNRDELLKLKQDVARLEKAVKKERDFMIGATLHSLRAICQIRDLSGHSAALRWSQKQSGSNGRPGEDGSYSNMRSEIRDLLIELDLLDGETGRFKGRADDV